MFLRGDEIKLCFPDNSRGKVNIFQAMTGCILLLSQTMIIGRHLFFMLNVHQSVVIQIRNMM